MKLCMSFIKDLLNTEIIEIVDPNGRMDDFDLEFWEKAAPGLVWEPGMLVVGDEESLGDMTQSVNIPMLCAGPGPDITVERLLAVKMTLSELVARVDNIFHSIERFEHRMNDAAYSAEDRDSLPELFNAMIDGKYVDRRDLKAALKKRKWSEEGPFLCACVKSGDIDNNRDIAPYYSRLIGGEINGACVFERPGNIACVVDLSWFNNSAETFMQENVEFFRDNIFRAGFSNEFSNILELQNYWKQAEVALRVGLSAASSFWYHRFSDRVTAYLLQQSVAELDPRYVCAPQLLELKKQDEENGTDYFNSLKVYLRNSMNAVQTAKDLFIHRGTMNYRLKRIEELTDLDLTDPDIRLYLEISFKILEMQEQ